MMYKIVLNQNFIHIGVPIFKKQATLTTCFKNKICIDCFFHKEIFLEELAQHDNL